MSFRHRRGQACNKWPLVLFQTTVEVKQLLQAKSTVQRVSVLAGVPDNNSWSVAASVPRPKDSWDDT